MKTKFGLLAALMLWSASAAQAQAPFQGLNNGVPFTPTLQVSSYAAGASLGGLQTLDFFRSTQLPSGTINSVTIGSAAGSAVPVTVYIFDTEPSDATTCDDHTEFVLAAIDMAKLATGPIVLTPAVVGSGTHGSTAQAEQNTSIRNRDSPPTNSVYVCITTNATTTPASTTDLTAKISGQVN